MKIVVVVVGEDPEVALNIFALDSEASSGSAFVFSKDESGAPASRIIQDLAQSSPPEDMTLRGALERYWPPMETAAPDPWQDLLLEYRKLFKQGRFGDIIASCRGRDRDDQGNVIDQDSIEEYSLRSCLGFDSKPGLLDFTTVAPACSSVAFSCSLPARRPMDWRP
mgnify:CR=1 FL=1